MNNQSHPNFGYVEVVFGCYHELYTAHLETGKINIL